MIVLYKLKKLNVVKVVEAENEKDKLIANGYKILEEKQMIRAKSNVRRYQNINWIDYR